MKGVGLETVTLIERWVKTGTGRGTTPGVHERLFRLDSVKMDKGTVIIHRCMKADALRLSLEVFVGKLE